MGKSEWRIYCVCKYWLFIFVVHSRQFIYFEMMANIRVKIVASFFHQFPLKHKTIFHREVQLVQWGMAGIGDLKIWKILQIKENYLKNLIIKNFKKFNYKKLKINKNKMLVWLPLVEDRTWKWPSQLCSQANGPQSFARWWIPRNMANPSRVPDPPCTKCGKVRHARRPKCPILACEIELK